MTHKLEALELKEVELDKDALASLTDISSKRKPDPMERFEEFWSAYPRRKDKKRAGEAWRHAVVAEKVDPQRMIDAAKRYAKEQRDSEPRHIKYPATWLTDARYDDEPDVPQFSAYGNRIARGGRVGYSGYGC